MLNEKLDYLTAEKIADAKFFQDTMFNSKNIILDTILGTRDGSESKMDLQAQNSTSEGLLCQR